MSFLYRCTGKPRTIEDFSSKAIREGYRSAAVHYDVGTFRGKKDLVDRKRHIVGVSAGFSEEPPGFYEMGVVGRLSMNLFHKMLRIPGEEIEDIRVAAQAKDIADRAVEYLKKEGLNAELVISQSWNLPRISPEMMGDGAEAKALWDAFCAANDRDSWTFGMPKL